MNKRDIGRTFFHLISLLSRLRLEIEQLEIFGRGHPRFGQFSNLKNVASQPLLLHAPCLISFLKTHPATLLYRDSLLHHHPIWEWETLGDLIFGIVKPPYVLEKGFYTLPGAPHIVFSFETNHWTNRSTKRIIMGLNSLTGLGAPPGDKATLWPLSLLFFTKICDKSIQHERKNLITIEALEICSSW